jgi:small subunit ribosomal protein S6
MKLLKAEVIREYELTYLMPVGFTDSELSKLNDELAVLLKKHKATVKENQSWGKKKLAYRLRHHNQLHTEANYFHVTFSANSQSVQELEKNLYLHPQIMRHLLVVAEPVKAVKASKKKVVATEEAEK